MANVPQKISVFCISNTGSFSEGLESALREDSQFEWRGCCEYPQAQQRVQTAAPEIVVLCFEADPSPALALLKNRQFSQPVIGVVPSLSVRTAAVAAGVEDAAVLPAEREKQKAFWKEILVKVRVACSLQRGKRLSQTVAAAGGMNRPAPSEPVLSPAAKTEPTVIAIGASTGGTEAILEVIRNLPAAMPGIVIVQHMPPVFTAMYAQRLNGLCQMEVREAKNMDRVHPGLVLIAAGGFHMRLFKDAGGYYIKSQPGEKVSGHCPSVNVLFESVAKTAGKDAIGVILTGMGADGAQYLLSMRRAGAYTIGQDKDSSIVYGMPMEAYKLGAVSQQLPLTQIAGELVRQVQLRRKK